MKIIKSKLYLENRNRLIRYFQNRCTKDHADVENSLELNTKVYYTKEMRLNYWYWINI